MKCSSQRCPGIFFSEIFEKSIDKHKIDAILVCAVQSERPCERLFCRWADASRRIPRKNPAAIPIQSAREFAGSFHVFTGRKGNGARVLCAVDGGVL